MLIAPYVPQLTDLVELTVTCGIAVTLMLAGAVCVGPLAPIEVQIGAGWGALCLMLTAWGVFLPLNLAIPATFFALGAVCVLAVRRRRPSPGAWATLGRTSVVTLPLWLIVAPTRPSQPDTWLNLLPNAFYLVDWGRFPTAALPPDQSYLPAAPYNTQLLSYFGGLVWPIYPAAGMSLINALLLVTAGLLIGRTVVNPSPSADAVMSWRAVAGGMLLVTVLNPGFVPRFHLSAYGETPLAVTAVMAAWLMVSVQGEIAAGRDPPPGALAAAGFVLAAMVNSKQSGIGLVAAVTAAAAVTDWAEGGRQTLRILRMIALVTLPALALYALWRYHVSVAGVAELRPLPPWEWNWSKIPETLSSIAWVISEKAVYFLCVATALVLWPVLLRRRGWTPTTRMLGFFGALFTFYNGFLMLMYLAVFPMEMSDAAHSYFRYNTHLSLVLVLALALAVRDLLPAAWIARVRSTGFATAVVALALLTPIAFITRLRFDLEMPQPLVWRLAKHLVPHLHDNDRLALLLPGDNDSVATMLAGVLADTPPRRRGLVLLRRSSAEPAALDSAARRGFRLVLISCTPPGLRGVPAGQAALLRWHRDDWHLLAAWSYPADDTGSRWQHMLAWRPLCRRG